MEVNLSENTHNSMVILLTKNSVCAFKYDVVLLGKIAFLDVCTILSEYGNPSLPNKVFIWRGLDLEGFRGFQGDLGGIGWNKGIHQIP